MFSLEDYLKERSRLVDKALDGRMPAVDTRPAVLHEAMRYSVFAGGKRLRPVLCLAACEVVGGSAEEALVPACAIELLHTYTLIHDDLPAMDDDDMRRGKPSNHKKFGEANAILAGDALLTMAFEWLADYPKLAKELAEAAGSQGMVAGQVEDLVGAGRKSQGEGPSAQQLEFIHLNKTAKLIRASARMGAIIGGAEPEEMESLSDYGRNIGLAFQISDDLMDEKDDDEVTALDVYGAEGARKQAQALTEAAHKQLRALPGNTEVLRAIANFVIQRTH